MTARKRKPSAKPKPKPKSKPAPRKRKPPAKPKPKLAPRQPGPMTAAFASTVYALYSVGRIDATHEAAIAQGALLAELLDQHPRAEDAPKWMTEYRQVWRVLMGDATDDGPDESPAAKFLATLAALHGRSPEAEMPS